MLLKRIVFASLLATALTSHAALFDDTEARKKILEVEEVGLNNDRSHRADIDALKRAQADIEARLKSIENIIQGGGLVELQNQIDTLKQEVSQLRGDLEVANHQLENAQQRQKDLYKDTDTRLRRIESGVTVSGGGTGGVVDGASTVVNGQGGMDEMNQIGTANAHFENGDYKAAFGAYDTFLKSYPNSEFSPTALYGLGYSQYALKSYQAAAKTQQKLLSDHPEHSKAPDAMYNLANAYIQLGQINQAKRVLSDLIKKHPNAAIIPSAKKRLKALKAL